MFSGDLFYIFTILIITQSKKTHPLFSLILLYLYCSFAFASSYLLLGTLLSMEASWGQHISLHWCEFVVVVKSQESNVSATSCISWWEQAIFQWEDNDVRFVVDQYALLDVYGARALKNVP